MSKTRSLFTYVSIMLGMIAALIALLHFSPIQNPESTEFIVTGASHALNNTLIQLLVALSFILIVTRIFGGLAKAIGEPAVVGEILGGILAGPSLLGLFFPAISLMLFPKEIHPYISIIAQLGIIFYMFVVGLEFDFNSLKNNAHSTILISHVSIVLPLICGVLLGFFTYQSLAPVGVNPTHFALFVGISLSITAFPVLARILTDKKLEKTNLGKVALACAAIDDVTAWCLLALCLSLMQSNISSGLITLGATTLYIAFVLLVIKPLLSKWILKVESKINSNSEKTEFSANTLAFFFVALFLSALSTEMIGIHAIFGAFLLGVIIPHNSRVKEELTKHTENLSKIVFLPAFFVFTGLRTQIGLLNTTQDWLMCAFIVFIAILGKFGGASIAAKLTGFKNKEAAAIGALMNTRGLVELVVLNIGLDMKIISERLFTMLVIMALSTTFMTSPLLAMILKDKKQTILFCN